MLKLQNSYASLPENFYHRVNPNDWENPSLVFYNRPLADWLEIPPLSITDQTLLFSGKKIISNSTPIAMAYAGHQFGHFVPQLGDGRAILLGEIATSHGAYDLHLKGSGETKYSRRGDGRCELGPALREYIVSEAMHALGIPTTRSLALNLTGEDVYREDFRPGAVLTRVAKSHIRVGTFEYFFYRNDFKSLKSLADYTINRLYPEHTNAKNKYLDLFRSVAVKQLELVSKWQSVGFIHGVMNTDNCAISGETIDYGPCAFMDFFQFDKVYSYIDRQGRYAFNNQDKIILWNLSAFAQTLIPLVHSDPNQSIALLEDVLSELPAIQLQIWTQHFGKKLGIYHVNDSDRHLIVEFLNFLQTNKLDFTNSFRELPEMLRLIQSKKSLELNQLTKIDGHEIYLKICQRLKEYSFEDCLKLMNQVNPFVIARNHQIEKAIQNAYQGDYDYARDLISAYQAPYQAHSFKHDLTSPPSLEEEICQTFCGT